MPRVDVNGTALYYQLPFANSYAGNRPVLVFVHGLGTNLAFWYLRIVPRLARDFRTVSYDLRGHGQSDMPPTGYTTADMASDLDQLLDRLEVPRAHLVGHSFGGAVALQYAAEHPDRVHSLTLADSRIRALQPTQRLADWPKPDLWTGVWRELALPSPNDEPDFDLRWLEAMAEARVQGRRLYSMAGGFAPFGSGGGSTRTARRWLDLLRTTSARRDFAATAGLETQRIRSVQTPVLAMFGEYSNCLPSCRALQRELSDCRVVIIPDAGHFHPVARPWLFEGHLRSFLRDVA
jgi:pimeloyl-ACP methyl ester carboxylesterase